MFFKYLNKKYKVANILIKVVIFESKKIYAYKTKQKVDYKPLLRAISQIGASSEGELELKIFNKYDGTDLSVQQVDNIKKDLKELSHLIYQSILYEKSLNFNQILQQKVKSATAKLKAQKAEIEEKYRFEKDMMGIMGHELRTPMTVARGTAELLLEKIKNNTNIDPAYLKEKLEKIFSSIIKEADLIQTMLSTSHIDNAKVNLQLSQFDLIELIEFAVTTFKKDANAKNLKLSFIRPEKEIPQIINDQCRVLEILNNLISNAIKYTNEGSVTVSVSEKNGFIEYSVKDTGIGIPKEEIKKIGKKFYRVNQYLDEKKNIVRAGGTGLGLYVVKGLLKAMGGKLKIESEEGVGSTFTAIFPVIVKLKNKESFKTDGAVYNYDMFKKLDLKNKY